MTHRSSFRKFALGAVLGVTLFLIAALPAVAGVIAPGPREDGPSIERVQEKGSLQTALDYLWSFLSRLWGASTDTTDPGETDTYSPDPTTVPVEGQEAVPCGPEVDPSGCDKG